MKKFVIAALGAAVLLTGCDKVRSAMSAHSNTVAKASGEELTVPQLAQMMGSSKAPLRKDIANAIVDAWVNYHLVAQASADGDSLKDYKAIDKAMWAVIANIKAKKWYDQVSKSWKSVDSAQAETAYNNGRMLAASHILLLTTDTTPAGKAKVKAKADAL